MLQLFHEINIDWLGKRRFFIGISIVLMLAGMGTAFYRHKFHPNGTEAFNLGVDFKGGTVITARFKNHPQPMHCAPRSVRQASKTQPFSRCWTSRASF